MYVIDVSSKMQNFMSPTISNSFYVRIKEAVYSYMRKLIYLNKIDLL